MSEIESLEQRAERLAKEIGETNEADVIVFSGTIDSNSADWPAPGSAYT